MLTQADSDFEERIALYHKTGEFSSRTGTDAVLAANRIEDSRLGMLRQEIRDRYTKHGKTLLEINRIVAEYDKAEREFENAQWLPRLREYYAASPSRGHKYTGDGFVAMMWGSAGRVLLTIQDAHGQNHPESRFGGANVTLIFDESSEMARGGLQSYIGTKNEVLGLIAAATKAELQFQPSNEVTVC